jgi:hypothetical protein
MKFKRLWFTRQKCDRQIWMCEREIERLSEMLLLYVSWPPELASLMDWTRKKKEDNFFFCLFCLFFWLTEKEKLCVIYVSYVCVSPPTPFFRWFFCVFRISPTPFSIPIFSLSSTRICWLFYYELCRSWDWWKEQNQWTEGVVDERDFMG